MEHKQRWIWAITCLFFLLFFHSCLPEENRSGFLTREVEVSEEYSGWEQVSYQTGRALAEANTENGPNYIYLEIDIPLPGRYYPWLLAALSEGSGKQSRQVRVRITPVRAHSRSIIDSLLITVPGNPLLSWLRPEGEKKGLEFVEYGPHFIVLEGLEPGQGRLILDKFLLASRPEAEPSGYAFSPAEKAAAVLPPAWAFGATYGGALDQEAAGELLEGLQKENIPIDALWTDFGSSGLPLGTPLTGGWSQDIRKWKKQGIHFGASVGPEISEAKAAEIFSVFESREYFQEPPPGAAGDRLGRIDFEVPEAVDYWKSLLQPLFRQKLDFLRLEPPLSTSFLQTAYELSTETGRRGWVLAPPSLLGDAGTLRYPGLVLSAGRPDWPEPVQKTALAVLANPRNPLHGAPFFGLENPAPATVGGAQAAVLWFQPLCLFRVDRPETFLAWATTEEFRYYAQMRRQLFPFLYSYAHRSLQSGENLIKANHRFPGQYFFGRELLVAPAAGAEAGSRSVHFPAGSWISYYEHHIVEGGKTQEYTAPAGRIPLFVRAGSILPMQPYPSSVSETGGSDTLILRIYPAGVESGTFTLMEDDGLSLDYRQGLVAATAIGYRLSGNRLEVTIAPVKGTYQGMPEERTWIVQTLLEEKPSRLRWNGEDIGPEYWSYDEKLKWLELRPRKTEKTKKQQLILSF